MISFKNFSRLVGISLLNFTFLLHQKLFVNHLITCFSSKDLQLTLYLENIYCLYSQLLFTIPLNVPENFYKKLSPSTIYTHTYLR